MAYVMVPVNHNILTTELHFNEAATIPQKKIPNLLLFSIYL